MVRRPDIITAVLAFAWIPRTDMNPQFSACPGGDGWWYQCWGWAPSPPRPLLVYLLGDAEPRDMVRTSPGSLVQEHHQAPALSFGYSQHGGPSQWPLMFPECGGSRQSPVDLDPRAMLPMDALQPLRWTNYRIPPSSMSVANNGHTVELTGHWEPPLLQPYISGGPLAGEYVFSQVHFHWGPEDHVGSEHTVSNISYPLEMHGVHYKKSYGNLQEALQHHDGVAVVAFFFQVGDHDNSALNNLISPISVLTHAHTRINVPHTFPLSMLKHEYASEYVTYFGSLTTPPCKEVVTWIIATTPLHMSHRQLEAFRSLSASGSMEASNFRPIQPLNHRLMFFFK